MHDKYILTCVSVSLINVKKLVSTVTNIQIGTLAGNIGIDYTEADFFIDFYVKIMEVTDTYIWNRRRVRVHETFGDKLLLRTYYIHHVKFHFILFKFYNLISRLVNRVSQI